MRLERYIACIYRNLVGNKSRSKRNYSRCIFLHKSNGRRHELQEKRSRRNDMAHNRLQLLSESHSHFSNPLPSLVKSGLYRRVLNIELVGNGSTFGKSLVCLLLFPTHHVKVSGKS